MYRPEVNQGWFSPFPVLYFGIEVIWKIYLCERSKQNYIKREIVQRRCNVTSLTCYPALYINVYAIDRTPKVVLMLLLFLFSPTRQFIFHTYTWYICGTRNGEMRFGKGDGWLGQHLNLYSTRTHKWNIDGNVLILSSFRQLRQAYIFANVTIFCGCTHAMNDSESTFIRFQLYVACVLCVTTYLVDSIVQWNTYSP